jgi:cell wall-associated NlpC family hydrolase
VLRPVLSSLAIVFAIIVFSPSNAQAQYWPSRERIYPSRISDGGPLQPFTFSRQPAQASAMRVAYYAPRPQRAQPIESADAEPEARTPAFDVSDSHPMVRGNRAVIRNGIAYAPSNAPDSVKHAIWAVNTICRRPYVWGGGHGSFHDYGYDCSGTVSFALHYAGLLGQPIPSSDFLRYGQRGRGRWFTIYSRHGHVWAMIAGLRLDTTDLRYGGDVGPRWHLDGRDTWGFEARHPVGL